VFSLDKSSVVYEHCTIYALSSYKASHTPVKECDTDSAFSVRDIPQCRPEVAGHNQVWTVKSTSVISRVFSMIRKLLNTVWSTVANDTQRQMPRNSTCWVVYKITLYLHCQDDNWVKQASHLVPVCHQATLAPRGGVWKEDGTLGRKMGESIGEDNFWCVGTSGVVQ